MKNRTSLLVASLLPLLASFSLSAACSPSSPSPDGSVTGGTNGSGAAQGVGGTGVPGTGGGAATGGSGTGGVTGTGGVPGVGGGSGGIAATGGDGSGGGAPITGVTVQMDQVRQIIRGFGINATIMPQGESLPWAQLFGTDGADALGLSILRIGMDENGGHRGVPSDWETARTMYDARIIGSCWTAPASWKDNNSPTAGGHLLKANYEQWAQRIADYAADNDLYAMSIGNETDFASCSDSQGTCNPPLTDEYESMVYTGKELAEFVAVAGPIFEATAPDTKVIAPEASLWIHVWSNLSPTGVANGGYESSDPLDCNCFSNTIDAAAAATCASHCVGSGTELSSGGYDYGHWLNKDPAAWAAFDILGVHEYESQVGYAWPADVNGGVKDKEVWQTEMSGVMYWPEQGPSTDINNGVAVAGWVHSALTVGEASAWLYWWYEAYYQNDNEGLALIQNSSTIAKRYYALGNYSRFIRPDDFSAVKVANGDSADVLVSAYKGSADKLVVVAINKGDAAAEIPITITGGTAPAMLTPHVTSATENLVAGAAVTVTGGVFTASLPAKSVTSFVSP